MTHLLLVIRLWHALNGFLGDTFEEILADFEHPVECTRVCDYNTLINEGYEAFDAGNQPHIIQISEFGTMDAMLKKNTFIPVDTFVSNIDFIDVVKTFYSTEEGRLLSLPWNASTGVVFYNVEAFKQAGIEKIPATWNEWEETFPKLNSGYTTAWPAAYHVEHFSFWHNLPLFSKGLEYHLNKVVEWIDKGYFTYFGRKVEGPESAFCEGKVAVLMQGANRLPLLEKNADFTIGVAPYPYWTHITKKPHTLNIGGASLWVFEGFSEEEYETISALLNYLSSTEVQKKWHEKTGYLPITKEVYSLCLEEGFYESHPAHKMAVEEVMGDGECAVAKGIRIPNYPVIREKIIDGLEKVFLKDLSPEEFTTQHQQLLPSDHPLKSPD